MPSNASGPAPPAATLADVASAPLVPLPSQPAGVVWPSADWPDAAPSERTRAAQELVDALFEDDERYGTTYAALVVHRGEIVGERYGGALPHFTAPPTPVERDTPLLSWSVAKSILHAAVGNLVGEGRLDPQAAAPVAAWQSADDGRRAITLEQLLCMRDGLDFLEDYVDDSRSDVIDMLFGSGQHDVAAYAASRPLRAEPGSTFNYSSGTSNIVSSIVAGVVGRGEPYRTFLHEQIFEPIGMRSATVKLDDAGTFIGSSYVYATARDFARFGLLYLRDGVWDGRRLLPEGWVDHGRRARSVDPDDGRFYGAHWWVVGDDAGSFWANGYEGQSILVCPGLDLVAGRLGRSARDAYPALIAWRAAVVDAFRPL